MGGGVITPPYNGWYETYNHHFDDQLTKADNLNTNLSFPPVPRKPPLLLAAGVSCKRDWKEER